MERTWKPTTAGILTIIGGIYGIAAGALLAIGGGFLASFTGMPVFGAIGGVPIALGIIALIGGIFALRRKSWGFALAGAILAAFLFPVGTVLGILAIIFVAMGKSEFQ